MFAQRKFVKSLSFSYKLSNNIIRFYGGYKNFSQNKNLFKALGAQSFFSQDQAIAFWKANKQDALAILSYMALTENNIFQDPKMVYDLVNDYPNSPNIRIAVIAVVDYWFQEIN